MKATKPMILGFASTWVLAAYLIHPILLLVAIMIFIAVMDR